MMFNLNSLYSILILINLNKLLTIKSKPLITLYPLFFLINYILSNLHLRPLFQLFNSKTKKFSIKYSLSKISPNLIISNPIKIYSLKPSLLSIPYKNSIKLNLIKNFILMIWKLPLILQYKVLNINLNSQNIKIWFNLHKLMSHFGTTCKMFQSIKIKCNNKHLLLMIVFHMLQVH